MIPIITYDGISSESFGTEASPLVCRTVKRPVMPGLKLNRVELPGSSGTFDFPSSEYGTKDIQIRMMYLSENYRDLRQKGHDLAYWLRPRESNSGSMPST